MHQNFNENFGAFLSVFFYITLYDYVGRREHMTDTIEDLDAIVTRYNDIIFRYAYSFCQNKSDAGGIL